MRGKEIIELYKGSCRKWGYAQELFLKKRLEAVKELENGAVRVEIYTKYYPEIVTLFGYRTKFHYPGKESTMDSCDYRRGKRIGQQLFKRTHAGYIHI